MPTFTKIVKVGAFTDDVAAQINNNFAQLGTVLSQAGIDPHTLTKAAAPNGEAAPDHWYTDPPPEPEPAPEATPNPKSSNEPPPTPKKGATHGHTR